MDTTAVEAAISAQESNVIAIGGAVLAVLAVIAGITYLRRVVR